MVHLMAGRSYHMEQDPELPDWIDKATTQSFKETFCAAVLLWAIRHRPTAASPAPTPLKSAKRALALIVIVYVVRHDPSQLVRQALQ
jgi:hypothetical protein